MPIFLIKVLLKDNLKGRVVVILYQQYDSNHEQ